MIARAALLASLTVVGCSGSQHAVPPPAPRAGVPAPAPTAASVAPVSRVQYRLTTPLRYEILRTDSLRFQAGSDNPPQVTGRLALVTVRNAAGRVVVTLDSISSTVGGRLAASTVDSARGVRWEFRLTGTGVAGDFRRNRSSTVVGQIEAALRLLFPQLPLNGASPGDTWADSATYRVALDAFDASESAVRQSRARVVPGSTGLAIDAEEVLHRLGSAVQGGRAMAIAGGGKRTLRYGFAAEGWVSLMQASDSLELKVTMTGGDQSIPVRWRSTVMARLRDSLPR